MEKAEDLPNFGEIKRVVDKYEEKMKKDLDQLEERKLLIDQEEKASRKRINEEEKESERRIHEEKEIQEEILRKERDNAMLEVKKKSKVLKEEKRDWEIEKMRVKATKTFKKIVTLNVAIGPLHSVAGQPGCIRP